MAAAGSWLRIGAMVAGGLALALLLASPWGRSVYRDLASSARPALGMLGESLATRAAVDLGSRVLLSGAVLTVVVAAARHVKWPFWATTILIVLLGLDLGSVDLPFLRKATGDLAPLQHPAVAPAAELARGDPTHRAMALQKDLFFSNDWIRWGARSISGYHPAAPLAWADLRRVGLLGSYAMQCALGVRYVSGEVRGVEDTSRYAPVAGERVWLARGALPRLYAVPAVVAVGDDADVLAMLAQEGFRPDRFAVTADRSAAGTYPGSLSASLRFLEDEPDRQTLEVTAPAPAFVVVGDAWFPGWRANLDGIPLEIHRVDHVLRGLAIPAGRHTLKLAYLPPAWRWSVAVTRTAWSAWILAVAGWALVRFRRRTRLPGTPGDVPPTQ